MVAASASFYGQVLGSSGLAFGSFTTWKPPHSPTQSHGALGKHGSTIHRVFLSISRRQRPDLATPDTVPFAGSVAKSFGGSRSFGWGPACRHTFIKRGTPLADLLCAGKHYRQPLATFARRSFQFQNQTSRDRVVWPRSTPAPLSGRLKEAGVVAVPRRFSVVKRRWVRVTLSGLPLLNRFVCQPFGLACLF